MLAMGLWRSVTTILLSLLYTILYLTAPAMGQPTAPAIGQLRDEALYDNPYVRTALVSFQPRFEGEILPSLMLPLQPGIREHTILDISERVDTPSLATQLYSAWASEAGSSCPEVVQSIGLMVDARYPGARLDDVQCFINPFAALGARFNEIFEEVQRTHLLWFRLFNRFNRIAFTVDMPGAGIDPRFILNFNLKMDIHTRLSRGAPDEAGQVIRVLNAEIVPWSVTVDAGNLGGHLANFFGNAGAQIKDSMYQSSRNVTQRIQAQINRGLEQMVTNSSLPLNQAGSPVYFRSLMSDESMRNGQFPILVLLGRPQVIPFDIVAEAKYTWIDLDWKLPQNRPIKLFRTVILESGREKGRVEPLTLTYNDSKVLPGTNNTYQVCSLNEFMEQVCGQTVSARADAKAILPRITVEQTNVVRLTWPAWTDENAAGSMMVRRLPQPWPTGERSFPLFVTGEIVDSDQIQAGDYFNYEFSVTSRGGQVTSQTVSATVGPGRTRTFRPMHPYSTRVVCASTRENGVEDGTPIILRECGLNLQGQLFAFYSDGTLRDANSRKCLTPTGTGNAGETVVLKPCVTEPTQKWVYRETGHDAYYLWNDGSGLCMETENVQFTVGTPLVMYPCNRRRDQRWAFEEPIH